MSRHQCCNCLTHHDGDYERCNNCVSKGYAKPTMWRPGPNYVPPSNADRIRAMSDEEMATELINTIFDLCEDGVPREDYVLNWLRQPVEED